MKINKLTLVLASITAITAHAETPSEPLSSCPENFQGTTCKVISGDTSTPYDNIEIGGLAGHTVDTTQNNDQTATIGDQRATITTGSDEAHSNSESHGGTYTTGDLEAKGGSVGNTSTGASTATTGNQSNTAHNSTGASTATNGAQSFDAGTTSNNLGQGQDQSSTNNINASDNSSQSLSTDVSTKDNRKQEQALNDVGNSTSNSVSKTNMKDSGNSTSASKNAMRESGNSRTSIDASDRSVNNYTSLSYRIPEITHQDPVTLANPTSSTVVTQCGPYTGVRSQAVTGKYMGLFTQTSLEQGYDDTIVSAVNQYGKPVHFLTEVAQDGSILYIGSQNIVTTSVISIGGGRNINIGGGFGAGDYGQAGGSNNSQAQRVVQNVQVVPCVYDIIKPEPEKPEEPKYLEYLQHGMSG